MMYTGILDREKNNSLIFPHNNSKVK